MAANLIDAPGTDEAAWRAWPDLARLRAVDVSRWPSVVILAAHPDDEVLGAGGIMAVLAAAGARLRVVAVTDGQASHPGCGDRAGLARRRAREREAAMAALGAKDTEVIRLGFPDAGLDRRQADLTAAVRDAVTGFSVCLAPWEGDVHADHEAVGRAAAEARGDAFWYPIWAWHWARRGDLRVPWGDAVRAALPAEAAARKRTAIGCFASQLEARPRGAAPVLAAGFVAHFTRDFEVLFPAGTLRS